MEQSAPILESVDIVSYGGEVTVDLFGGQAPRLRHIAIWSVRVPFQSHIFSGLKSLAIQNLSLGPSTSQLRRILEACPSLTALTLSNIQGVADTPIEGLDELVVLTQLKRMDLTIGEPESDYYSTLFTGIRAPNCAEFILKWGLPMGYAPTCTAILGPFIDPLKSILAVSDGVFFHISDPEFSFQDQNGVGQPKVLLKLTTVVPSEVFAWVVETFREEIVHKPTILKLGPTLNRSKMDFLPVLDLLQEVTEVSIRSNSTVAGGILK